MVRKLAALVFVVAVFAAVSAGRPSVALASGTGGCTQASIAGSFGFSYNGVGILPTGPVPIGALGRFHTDSAGNVVGSETNSLGGVAAFQTITGTITVHSDCSALLVANVYQNGQLVRMSVVRLQYENNSNDVQGIFTKVTLPDNSTLPVVITITGKRTSDS
jgi:hypothetical protein